MHPSGADEGYLRRELRSKKHKRHAIIRLHIDYDQQIAVLGERSWLIHKTNATSCVVRTSPARTLNKTPLDPTSLEPITHRTWFQ